MTVEWPIRVRYGQARALVEHHALPIGPASPFEALLAEPCEPVDDALATDARVARMLQVLAAPRQLLAIRGEHAEDAGLLLSDDDALVRFDAGSDGFMASAPHDHEVLAELICDWSGAPEDAAAETRLASRFFLEVLEAVVAAARDGAVAVDAARAGIAASLEAPERAGAVLDALIADGAAHRDGDVLHLDAGWLETNAFLLAASGVTVVAYECADLALGLSRPTALTILRSDPPRLVVLPPTLSEQVPDTVLAFEPLTRRAVGAGVAALLSPPIEPPARPAVAYDGDAGDWLARAPAENGSWHDAIVDQLGDEVPAVLFAPAATIELVARGSGRQVIALAPEAAVEWTTSGSRIRWRTLGDVAGRIEELLPAVPAPELDATTPLPDALGRLTAIRALALDGDVLHGVELVLGEAAGGALWQVERTPTAHQVLPASAPGVLRELREALAPVEL
jgi:hypothetical protein